MYNSLASACALTVSLGACITMAVASQPGDTKTEFGAVKWGRELEPALDSAEASKKPVMLLFQEVPG